MRILILNTGSSSLKYRLSDVEEGDDHVLAEGIVERIGTSKSSLSHQSGERRMARELPIKDHREAFNAAMDCLTDSECGVIRELESIEAVGHRVVHGGDRFYESVLISEDVIRAIDQFGDLAPLHNPINLLGIHIATDALGGIPHVAVFDTAFHQTIPETAHIYALPLEMYHKYRIRRYGFHGTSHQYVSMRAAELLGRNLRDLRIITCHLGNGCSMAAIEGGESRDTTMGFTPLEGLVMGTRSGDIDPSIVFYLVNSQGFSLEEVEDMLNKESGVLGVSGLTNDIKTLIEASRSGNDRATLALEIFAYRVRKYMGAYIAVLGGLDCLVFTAGIGERSAYMRELICSGLEELGISLDPGLNSSCYASEMVISKEGMRTKVVVIPTDEEHMIALETYRIASRGGADV